jgi:hypothetical protein
MSRTLLAAVLAAVLGAPLAAQAQSDVETRTLSVGDMTIVDVKPKAAPGAASSAATAANSPGELSTKVRGEIPMVQVLALPSPPPRDR